MIKMKWVLSLLIFIGALTLDAQEYTDYLGAGHSNGITIRSSGTVAEQKRSSSTINADGLEGELVEAARFLSQSTLGANMDEISRLADMGVEAWIEEQLLIPPSSIEPVMQDITQEIKKLYLENGLPEEDFFGPWAVHFNYAWWQNMITENDLLRQKVALALSEILVISHKSELVDHGDGLSNYYDLLLENAFGNYADLLYDVTLHPMMGAYLSHLGNPKTNIENNTRPDQNYAREVMQLFTIGLYELNLDGTRKLDTEGNPIPSYDNTIIEEMAKVFTGLGAGDVADYVDWTDVPYWELGFWGTKKTVPMKMYEDYHEPGEKNIVNGYVVNRNNQNQWNGLGDIREAINVLVNHQNTAPFISYRLIQRLVTSNPSPNYVERVAKIFIDNGSGEVGDLGAVVRAILLDPEARDCTFLEMPDFGKLREPIQRHTQLSKAFDLKSPQDRYWNNGMDYLNDVGQFPLGANSVFNFFRADYTPVGIFSEQNMVGPEYQIHNSKTAIEYFNKVNQWVVWDAIWWSWEGYLGVEPVSLILTDLLRISHDSDALLNHLDILFTNGQMTEKTKEIIREGIESLDYINMKNERVRLALYLTFVSPDYAVQK